MSEGGRLDLSSSGLRPHELVELAPQLTHLTELILDGNGIFGVLPDRYGRGAEPDKFIDQCEPFFAALKDSPITCAEAWHPALVLAHQRKVFASC